jgi:hypothetical protein
LLSGLAHPALLDTYTTERSPDLQHAIQQSLFLGGSSARVTPPRSPSTTPA